MIDKINEKIAEYKLEKSNNLIFRTDDFLIKSNMIDKFLSDLEELKKLAEREHESN